jgi:hypothetical protein
MRPRACYDFPVPIPLDCPGSLVQGGRVLLRSTRILLAAALVPACGVHSECIPDTQRCQDDTPLYCLQSPSAGEGVGVWVSGASCSVTGLVCRVDASRTASCVKP